jgi:3-dehydroquinate dehydratase-2
MKILIINGPNLNLLGERDTTVYGSDTLISINNYIEEKCINDQIDFFQSNHEGAIIDRIHQARKVFDGIVINPGAYAHYSYAIRDALEACPIPVVEIHLSDIYQREKFRRISVTGEVCQSIISGKGKDGYLEAIEKIRERLAS